MVGSVVRREAPWTSDSREVMAVDEAREAFVRYFHGSMKDRNWLPWDDLPLAEIRAQGATLGADTVAILHGLIGLEDAANDVVADALQLVHRRHALRNLYLAWGLEELKHAEVWVLVLIEAGQGDDDDLLAYRGEVTADRWRLRDDVPALSSPLGALCYGLVQEQSFVSLYGALAAHLRAECGLPAEPTEAERAGGLAPGIVGAAQLVARDELAHRDTFLDMVRTFARHLPDETRATLRLALDDFQLPALGRLPDRAPFLAALARTGIVTPERWDAEVREAVLGMVEGE